MSCCGVCPKVNNCDRWATSTEFHRVGIPPYCRKAIRKRMEAAIKKYVLVGLGRVGRVEHIYQPILPLFANIARFARMIGVRGVLERKRRLRYLRDKALRAAVEAVERAARLQETLRLLSAASEPLFDEQRATEGKPDFCKDGRCTVPAGEKLLVCRGFKAKEAASVTCRYWRLDSLDVAGETEEFCDRNGKGG